MPAMHPCQTELIQVVPRGRVLTGCLSYGPETANVIARGDFATAARGKRSVAKLAEALVKFPDATVVQIAERRFRRTGGKILKSTRRVPRS